MIQATQKNWLNKLAFLYENMQSQNDQLTELIDLMQKADRAELTIAFCGHFSAGKSSLMNHLFGTNLLPTSPIPTSANVVTVKRGTDQVWLRFLDGREQQVIGTYNETTLQALMRDGDRAIEVMIQRQDLPIPEGVAIVDTPGIDSTDEDHRLATEAHLHVADIIFYMMDYNHVQAEGNLQFIKSLTERGKQVYPIINQIDKHRQSELPFTKFQLSVSDSFAAWEIPTDNVFYTSLKQPNHPHNQLAQVKSLLYQLYEEKESLIEQNLQLETHYLIKQYMKQKTAALLPLNHCIEQQQKLTTAQADLTKKLQQRQQERKEISSQLLQELDKLLQSAYLMPASLRELAKAYLESMQPGFKVGFLFAGNKTEQDRQQRQNAFFQALSETVATQLTGHVEELVLQHARKHGIFAELREELDQSIPPITPELLSKTIKPGAGITGNYILTYTTDLAEEIKNNFRSYVRTYLNRYSPLLEAEIQSELDQLTNQLNTVDKDLNDIANVIQTHHQLEQKKQQLSHMLGQEQIQPTTISIDQLLTKKLIAEPTTLTIEQESSTLETPQLVEQTSNEISAFAQKQQVLRLAEDVCKEIPQLQTLFESLQTKRLQMEKQQFTVALFGAFSAGKSSFANALLGDALLPVSPNPTTATVCRICPPNEAFSHGQGTVTFKSRETLTVELVAICQLFQQRVTTLEEALARIPQLLSEQGETNRQKLALPFIRAIEQGFHQIEPMLGTSQTMTQDDVTDYIANEAKSAFVEEVSLYVDSALAKLGITLVDTPGADSMHARHTDVSFRYMKQADALLFVTYYNHAFSRADRELLIQLGRVQDTFALDKMYFIVNAADLAASETELTTVVSYVEEQLTQYGLRFPRMFAVSSLQSLMEKQQKQHLNPTFAHFEQAFKRFIQEDSRQAILQRMTKDVQQATQLLNDILTSLHANEEEKVTQKIKWQQAETKLLQHLATLTSKTEQRAMAQEIKTLLYYVGERLRLRYYDEFAEFINPSTIRAAGRLGRKQLALCATELLTFISDDLIQEFRATTLRLYKWIRTAAEAFQQQLEVEIEPLLASLMLHDLTISEKQEPDWTKPTWDDQDKQFQQAIAIYKNNQSFFEANARDQMREQLKVVMDAKLTQHINMASEQMSQFFYEIWESGLETSKQQWELQISKHFTELETTLQSDFEEEPIVDAKAQLEQSLARLR